MLLLLLCMTLFASALPYTVSNERRSALLRDAVFIHACLYSQHWVAITAPTVATRTSYVLYQDSLIAGPYEPRFASWATGRATRELVSPWNVGTIADTGPHTEHALSSSVMTALLG